MGILPIFGLIFFIDGYFKRVFVDANVNDLILVKRIIGAENDDVRVASCIAFYDSLGQTHLEPANKVIKYVLILVCISSLEQSLQ